MPNNTPETGVTFFRSGGHNHDGVNSSPIATSNYSIFDFGVDVTTNNQDRARELNRDNNRNRFNQYISSFISTQVLAPAGIELAENSVRGIHIGAREISTDEIALNTITANNLANIITIDTQIVQSGNYIANTSGWLLSSNGFAEFGNVKVRGEVNATSGTFSGSITSNATITGGTISGGTISGGEININSGTFRVYSNGTMSASAANISGNITASGGTIGGWTIGSDFISGGAGATILYSNGYISASSSNLTTPTISTPSITNGSGTSFGITNGTSSFNANGYISSVSGLLSSFSLGSNTFTQGDVSLGGSVTVSSGDYLTTITGGKVQFKYSGTSAGIISSGYDAGFGGRQIVYDANSHFFDNSSYFVVWKSSATTYFYANLPTGSGNTLYSSSGQFVRAVSRREYKYDIQTLQNGLEKIKQLNPVNFKYRFNQNDSETVKFLKDNDIKTGFIVEDVELVDRGLINYDHVNPQGPLKDSDFDDPSDFVASSYDVNGIVSILTKAVQELIVKVETLEGVVNNGS